MKFLKRFWVILFLFLKKHSLKIAKNQRKFWSLQCLPSMSQIEYWILYILCYFSFKHNIHMSRYSKSSILMHTMNATANDCDVKHNIRYEYPVFMSFGSQIAIHNNMQVRITTYDGPAPCHKSVSFV